MAAKRTRINPEESIRREIRGKEKSHRRLLPLRKHFFTRTLFLPVSSSVRTTRARDERVRSREVATLTLRSVSPAAAGALESRARGRKVRQTSRPREQKINVLRGARGGPFLGSPPGRAAATRPSARTFRPAAFPFSAQILDSRCSDRLGLGKCNGIITSIIIIIICIIIVDDALSPP